MLVTSLDDPTDKSDGISETMSISTLFDSKMNDGTLRRSHDSTDGFCFSSGVVHLFYVEFIWISSAEVKAFNCLQVGSICHAMILCVLSTWKITTRTIAFHNVAIN